MDGALVHAADLGKLLDPERPVSRQAINNWKKAGCPTAGSDRLGFLYDVEVVRAWLREHRPNILHGGRREGAGAKPKSVDSLGQKTIGEAQAERVFESGTPVDVSSPEAILASVGKNTPSGATVLAATMRAAVSNADLLKKLGKLVDRAEVEAAFGEHLTVIRLRLESIPTLATQTLAGVLALDAEKTAIVRAELQRHIDETIKALGQAPLIGEAEVSDAA